jgi:hypothetical protein
MIIKDWLSFSVKAREICDHFLTLAATSLLADMKLPMFFLNLCRAAENWRRYFIASKQFYQEQAPLLYNAPLYAAIVANDVSLINSISSALPKIYKKGEEYEDNFHLSWLLILLTQSHCQSSDLIEEHIRSMSMCAKDPLKIDMIKALLTQDELTEDDFWSFFETALYAYDEEVQKKINTATTSLTAFIAHRYIWFEGLVWLRLAQTKGFTLPSGAYMFCPDEALGKMPEPYAGDWLLIPLPNDAAA